MPRFRCLLGVRVCLVFGLGYLSLGSMDGGAGTLKVGLWGLFRSPLFLFSISLTQGIIAIYDQKILQYVEASLKQAYLTRYFIL